MPAFVRVEMITNAQRSANEMAQTATLAKYPEIAQQSLKMKQDQIKALK